MTVVSLKFQEVFNDTGRTRVQIQSRRTLVRILAEKQGAHNTTDINQISSGSVATFEYSRDTKYVASNPLAKRNSQKNRGIHFRVQQIDFCKL